MRTNNNRTTGETKTLRKEKQKPLDVNDLLIETRLQGNNRASDYNLGMVSSIKGIYKRAEFSRVDEATETSTVIHWWEARRPFFNVVVGCTGIVTCFLLLVCAFSSDALVGEAIGLPDGPFLGVFLIPVYAIFANICYTAGWVVELLVRAACKADAAAALATKMFRWGITFSIFVTLSPAILCWIAFGLALLRGQKQGPIGE